MKRMKGELRYDFCARRIVAQEEQKEKLRPRLVHASAILVPHPGKEYADLPESQRPLVKVTQQGTYRKPKPEVVK